MLAGVKLLNVNWTCLLCAYKSASCISFTLCLKKRLNFKTV